MRTTSTPVGVQNPLSVPSFDSIRERAERTREAIADTVDDSLRSMRRVATRGRNMAEDATSVVRLRIRHDPLRAVGMALAVGALSGVVMTRLLSRRGHRRRFW